MKEYEIDLEKYLDKINKNFYKLKLKNVDIIINSHTLEKINERSKFTKDDFKNIKIVHLLQCVESSNDLHFFKIVWYYKGFYFPVRIFYKDNKYYIKVISILTDKQFKLSNNLNFGYIHKHIILNSENINISFKDIFFDENYVNLFTGIMEQNIDSNKILNNINNYNGIINAKGNKVLENYSSPVYIEYNNKYYKIVF